MNDDWSTDREAQDEKRYQHFLSITRNRGVTAAAKAARSYGALDVDVEAWTDRAADELADH